MVPSRCTGETHTARAKVAFEIAGYSRLKGLGRGECLRSPAFSIGGYEWCICYYPDGQDEASEGYVSVFLKLLTKDAEVRATHKWMLVNRVRDRSIVVLSSETIHNRKMRAKGVWKFMKTTAEVESVYLRSDCLLSSAKSVLSRKHSISMCRPPTSLIILQHCYRGRKEQT